MLKTHERHIVVLQALADALLAAAFWLVTYFIRFRLFPGAQEGLESLFVKTALLIAGLTVYVFRREGLYRSYRLSSRLDELLRVARANIYAVVVFVVVLYFFAPERLSRGVILGYFTISTVGFIVYRLFLRSFLGFIRGRGRNLRHVLLVGRGRAIERYVENIKSFPGTGIHFAGWADSGGLAQRYGVKPIAGDLDLAARQVAADSIVVNYEGEETQLLHQRLKDLHNDVIPIVVLPDLTYSFVGFETEHLAGVPALILNQPNYSTFALITKRIIDVTAAGLGLIVLSPFLAVISVGVKLSSPGPIFFAQERVGLDGRRFKMWKFRSMRVGSQETNGVPGWTQANDPRRTQFGGFIRETSIDELPQLWNVLVGDMSLVGPRPEQPFYVDKFRSEIPAYMLRHKVKAGITGWAQVNGWRGDTSLHKRIECDLYYIRHWSLWLDMKILFVTIWKGFINKNAY